MKKFLASAAIVAALVGASLTTSAPAQAGNNGAAFAVGTVFGLTTGAIIANEYNRRHAVTVYDECHWERRKYWNGHRWKVRKVKVCY
jgi:hypothetical protein